ncbi:oxidoreductase, short chain dehydrogenase/reductase family [Teredinibacter turnerae T7901]|uniref:Oxidoreductase, short chain dehydrogenase/reductase family n=1 Tax=Teredinibacter turnerae (strain ATCC 39867 / T7901) TaxID=377629 RepID=C5BLZ1_TERTT|nr:oxidoreductase [Teredinibacter turnerae]ACR13160.1 oxidoreductase, short chain dehydrogenase/reductase family [Teredinibacter turnerae T7901]
MKTKTILVTGASSGIGLAVANAFAEMGHTVYAAARREEQMREACVAGVKILKLDLTDEASISACVAIIKAESGGVDVLVNNAGYGEYGALEQVPVDDGRRQFEVNLFGLASLTQKLIAPMRERGAGRIINVSSVGGSFTTAFGGWYHATKFGLEGYSGALRQELKPFGIDVAIIKPGGTRSEWAQIAGENLVKNSSDGPYAAHAAALKELFATGGGNEKLQVGPEVIVKLIAHAAFSSKPKVSYVPSGLPKLMMLFHWILPARRFDKLMAKGLKLDVRHTSGKTA